MPEWLLQKMQQPLKMEKIKEKGRIQKIFMSKSFFMERNKFYFLFIDRKNQKEDIVTSIL